MSRLCPALAGQVVAIDGKTERGSRQRRERAIHLMSAYGCGLGMVLGQVRTADKSNEITAIPELHDSLMLKGAMVTNGQYIVGARLDDAWEYREQNKGHGRIETRRCLVTDAFVDVPFKPDAKATWESRRSIVMIESMRRIGEDVTRERRYFLSSLAPNARRIAHAVRTHWAIESMHWTLDMAFGEDQCRVRVKNAAHNFAVLRRSR